MTVIRIGDSRDTVHTVETIPVGTGECCAEYGHCGKPGALAVRNTIDQQRPTESSTMRVTVCAEHEDGAAWMHAAWAADARQMQDPVKHAEWLATVGISA